MAELKAENAEWVGMIMPITLRELTANFSNHDGARPKAASGPSARSASAAAGWRSTSTSSRSSPESWDFTLNEGLLEKILATFDRVSRRTGRRLEVSLDSLLRVPQLIEVGRRALGPKETAFLERCFERILDDVLALRRHEGHETARQLRVHLAAVRRSVARVEAQFRRQPALLKAKLKRRLMEFNGGTPVPEAKLAEEASFLAQRYDLAEEIGRLKTHLESFEELLSPKLGEPVGRQPIDFLAQELKRHIQGAKKLRQRNIFKKCEIQKQT